MRKKYNPLITWRAFPLHPETPLEGRPLKEVFRGREIEMEATLLEFGRIAGEEGLPFGVQTMIFNSRRAQELGKWSESKGKGEMFHTAVFRAVFAEGKNIAKIPVLMKLAALAGLPPGEAEEVLREGIFRKAVDRDWNRSRRIGIKAVPSLRLNGRVLVGARPYGVMEKFFKENSAAGCLNHATSLPETRTGSRTGESS